MSVANRCSSSETSYGIVSRFDIPKTLSRPGVIYSVCDGQLSSIVSSRIITKQMTLEGYMSKCSLISDHWTGKVSLSIDALEFSNKIFSEKVEI